MKSRLVSILKYILLLAISFGLLVVAFKGVSLRTILGQISLANPFWIIVSVIISLVAFVSRAIRWNLLIESLDYSPPIRRTLYALLIGYLANLAFPRLGEVTRCGMLSKSDRIPITGLMGTVIVERIIDVLSLLFCMLLATVLEYQRIGNFLNENISQPLLKTGIRLITSPFVIAGGIALILVFISIYYYSSKTQNGRATRFIGFIKELYNGMKSIAKLKRPWLFIFHSVFIWVLAILGLYVSFFALPHTSHLGFNAAIFLTVAAGLGMAAPVQGGLGAFHLLVSQGLILYGLSQQDGLTFATLVHTLSLLMVILAGIVSLFLYMEETQKRLKNQNGGDGVELLNEEV